MPATDRSKPAFIPGRTTLDETPARALQFLRAMGVSLEARAALRPCGFDDDAEAEGWRLLMGACRTEARSPRVHTERETKVNAWARIDAWVGPGFRRAHAALGRLHPAQDEFVFDGIRDVEPILALMHFLDRCDTLERGRKKGATRKADRAALATLAKRGITKEVRVELGSLLEAAKRGSATPQDLDEDKTRELALLYAWLQDWAETAKAVVTSKALLIKMGFARRRPMERTRRAHEASAQERT
jgi:hypothetical protein